MNQREYADYQATIAEFMAREGIVNLSRGHITCPNCWTEWDEQTCQKCKSDRESCEEPFFSWKPCECCGSSLGGKREHATGYNSALATIREYNICGDCVYYAEYGRLDDTTMEGLE